MQANAQTEWYCAATTRTGNFKRSTDCVISGSNHVEVTNTLEINGTNTDMNNLITITATTSKRHFYFTGNVEDFKCWPKL